MASNLVYTIWAVFGGFILHFLLSNYLTVLLKPSFEEPVETVEDVIKRNLIPFFADGGEFYKQHFADSPDPNYREISRRLVVAKDWDEYEEFVQKTVSTGLYADIGPSPTWINSTEERKLWYRSSETIPGDYPFQIHLTNKKWPLKKVLLLHDKCSFYFETFFSFFRNMTLIF